MKKYFIIAACALVASVACTKSEKADGPDVEVKFQIADYKTKAGPTSFLSEFADPADAKFSCKAFLHAEGVTETQDFFGASGETITYNGSDAWEPSHPYYWPKSENSYINFVSYYDTGVGPTTVTETSLEWAARTIGTGDNIMYADEAWRFHANNNPASYGKDGVTEGVPTLFHHALGQIQVKAYATKLEDANATWTITLEDITIGAIYNKGTLTLTNAAPSTDATTQAWTGSWVTDTSVDGSLAPANTSVTADAKASAVTVLANQSVLPQNVSAASIDFKVRIVTTYKTGGQTNTELITKSVPFGTGGFETPDWAMNTKYSYYIKIDPATNEVLFDPAVAEEWIVAADAEYEY